MDRLIDGDLILNLALKHPWETIYFNDRKHMHLIHGVGQLEEPRENSSNTIEECPAELYA